MIAAVALAVLVATVPPGGAEQADISFTALLDEMFPDAEFSAAPYCTVSENGETATCEALVDGEQVAYVGVWDTLGDDGYHEWQTVEEANAEAAADEQFPIWVTETFGLELDPDEVTSCFVAIEDGAMHCFGLVADGRLIEATAPLPSDGVSFEFVTEFVDAPEFDTPLAAAVYACSTLDDDEELVLDANGEPVAEDGDFYFDADEELSFDDFVVLDEGHSVDLSEVDDLEPFQCLHQYLGWPDWVMAQINATSSDLILWTTVEIEGYTITWAGETVVVYDEEVGG